MSMMNLSVKHGRTLEEARARLEMAVSELCTRFGSFVHRVEWNAHRTAAKLFGPGFEGEIRVDAQEVYASLDVPLLVGLFSSPLLSGMKAILEQQFQKRLTADKGPPGPASA
ncbi:MAG TPA: polyhydroxyalkanoic acid system family protein [Gemmataceae bacterium]|jgi:hypothetical protein|nr:polyhydroxyalkanoic acid system family protein [Gemmataceae bacterium]